MFTQPSTPVFLPNTGLRLHNISPLISWGVDGVSEMNLSSPCFTTPTTCSFPLCTTVNIATRKSDDILFHLQPFDGHPWARSIIPNYSHLWVSPCGLYVFTARPDALRNSTDCEGKRTFAIFTTWRQWMTANVFCLRMYTFIFGPWNLLPSHLCNVAQLVKDSRLQDDWSGSRMWSAKALSQITARKILSSDPAVGGFAVLWPLRVTSTFTPLVTFLHNPHDLAKSKCTGQGLFSAQSLSV